MLLVCALFLLATTLLVPVVSQSEICESGSRCFGDYCSGRYSQCVDGYCRCPNDPNRDYCTCSPISGSCHIVQGSQPTETVGLPTFNNRVQTNWSCTANENCNYNVHVISNYEGDSVHGFGRVRTTGTTYVDVNVSGEGSKPLVLVFVTYEPVRWILTTTPGVVIDTVLLGSYYLADSSVTGGTVLHHERHSYSVLPYGYGNDDGGGNTVKLLEYVTCRFGPISSFTGSYRADRWTLNIERGNTPGCPVNSTLPPPSSSTLSGTTCPRLGSIWDGQMNVSSSVCNQLTVGTVASFSCDPGYALNGPSNLTCLASGSWSGTKPYCQRQYIFTEAPSTSTSCNTLFSPSNGRVSFTRSSLIVGTRAYYSCNFGYTLSGSSTRTCLSTGSWSGSQPFCVRDSTTSTRCVRLFSPANGRVRYSRSDLTVGTRASYSCFTGYSFSGSSSRTCLSSGSWSGFSARCVRISTNVGSFNTQSANTIGAIVGSVVGFFLIIIFVCVLIVKLKHYNQVRTQTSSCRTHFNLQPATTSHPTSQQTTPATYTFQSRVTSASVTTNEVTVPNSELQEQPPPDYSTALRYEAYKPELGNHPSQDPPAYSSVAVELKTDQGTNRKS